MTFQLIFSNKYDLPLTEVKDPELLSDSDESTDSEPFTIENPINNFLEKEAIKATRKLEKLIVDVLDSRNIYNQIQRETVHNFPAVEKKEKSLFDELDEALNFYKELNEGHLIKKGLISQTLQNKQYIPYEKAYYYGKEEEEAIKQINSKLNAILKYLYDSNGSKFRDVLNDFIYTNKKIGGYVLGSYCYMWTARARCGIICATHKKLKLENPLCGWCGSVPDCSIVENIFNNVLNSRGLMSSYNCGRLD